MLPFAHERMRAPKTFSPKPPRSRRLLIENSNVGRHLARSHTSTVEVAEKVTQFATIAHAPYPEKATMRATVAPHTVAPISRIWRLLNWSARDIKACGVTAAELR